jgi:UrcA family protein
MNINATVLNAKSFIYITVLATCALLSGPLEANERIVTVKVSVNTVGLDVGQPAGGRELYSRLAHAAAIVCGGTDRVGLQAVYSFSGCIETTVGEAVRSANLPQLSVAYLRTHTLQQAATLGIDVPAVLVAAK